MLLLNVDFVKLFGMYDEVVVYSDVFLMDVKVSVFVDMVGNMDVMGFVYRQFVEEFKVSVVVGVMYWEIDCMLVEMFGLSFEFFFVLGQIQKCEVEWGLGVVIVKVNEVVVQVVYYVFEYLMIFDQWGFEVVQMLLLLLFVNDVLLSYGFIVLMFE